MAITQAAIRTRDAQSTELIRQEKLDLIVILAVYLDIFGQKARKLLSSAP